MRFDVFSYLSMISSLLLEKSIVVFSLPLPFKLSISSFSLFIDLTLSGFIVDRADGHGLLCSSMGDLSVYSTSPAIRLMAW